VAVVNFPQKATASELRSQLHWLSIVLNNSSARTKQWMRMEMSYELGEALRLLGCGRTKSVLNLLICNFKKRAGTFQLYSRLTYLR
jgi:hypothetical protein